MYYVSVMTDDDSKSLTDLILSEIRAGSVSVGKEGRLETAEGKDLAAVLLGRRGGLKGGKARASALSAEQRKAIAQRAAAARWKKEG